MAKIQHRLRRIARRPGAENYLLITLLSFAASVTLTRLLLQITGYPQVGVKELHIAHILWGGLLLFAASLLPLLVANRWVYPLSALLSGIGVGLFMDEVGKFITQNNNYFYPPAAPIIYAFFLLTVLLYTRVRRRPSPNPRDQLYEVLEELEEVLDHDLDMTEKVNLVLKLEQVSQAKNDPDLANLATTLLHFFENDQTTIVPEKTTVIEKIITRIGELEQKYIKKSTLRAILSGGLLALGIYSLMQSIPLLTLGSSTLPLQRKLAELVQAGLLRSSGYLDWFSAWLVLEGLTGFLLVLSSIFLAFKAERPGMNLSYLSLLLSLTVVDLLLFYFDQFSSILNAAIQVILLWGVLYYRKNFMPPNHS